MHTNQTESNREPLQSPGTAKPPSPFKQPKAVFAIAFACVVSFMGIGLVDPILPAISSQLNATPSQVTLLFTSYLVVTAVAMLFTGWVSSRIGSKRTLIVGLVIIVIFSTLAGFSDSIGGLVGFRAGWGVGNALFIATSLAVIVASASGGFVGAIVLYESALGIGIAVGPLLGGLLGNISWRGPFFGVAVLMAIALLATITMVKPMPLPKQKISILAPLRALRHRGLLTMSLVALCYNWGFFTVLGYAPFPMGLNAMQLGMVFFGWGIFVAFFAVFGAPWLQRRLGISGALYLSLGLFALTVLVIAIWVETPVILIIAVIITGIFIGINNTVMTQAVMTVSPVDRSIASAAYGFVRFIGGGLAPMVAGILVEAFNIHVPFYVGAGAIVVGIVILTSGRGILKKAEEAQASEVSMSSASAATTAKRAPELVAVGSTDIDVNDTSGQGDIVVAINGSDLAERIAETAARIAVSNHLKVHIVHVLESVITPEAALAGEDIDDASEIVRKYLDRFAAQGLPALGHVLRGATDHAETGRIIANYANDIAAQTIVIGAPTHGGLPALMDASASTELWRNAHSDIVIVNPERSVPAPR